MIDINTIRKGMVLISHEPDPLWAEEPRKKERMLFGVVYWIDYKKREVTLMMKNIQRVFKPENLWYLPYETEPINIKEKLMGFIVGISTGQVGKIGLQQVAEELKQRGIGPIKAEELIKVL